MPLSVWINLQLKWHLDQIGCFAWLIGVSNIVQEFYVTFARIARRVKYFWRISSLGLRITEPRFIARRKSTGVAIGQVNKIGVSRSIS